MKRARDIRDQLEALMERVEIEVVSNPHETQKIRKVYWTFSHHTIIYE
jgi:pre-mRNA-splicing factor ATP-dependent RNA helicase DHX16